MAAFLDVLLRGLALVCTSLALGGVAWLRFVVRLAPGTKPDAADRRTLAIVAASSALAGAAQLAVMLVALTAVAGGGAWPIAQYLGTTFAQTAIVRIALAVGVSLLAVRLARRPGGRVAWLALASGTIVLAASSAVVSHAMGRIDHRVILILLDAAHQVAGAVWVGALAHLTIYAIGRSPYAIGRSPDRRDEWPALARRSSTLAFSSVATLVAAGLALTWLYVGDARALVETAYGVMIVSKMILLAAALVFAAANRRAVRSGLATAQSRTLFRYVEVELGLGVTVLFAAASLTSLPPAVDVHDERATLAEVASRFKPAAPRLTSPDIAELNRTTDPLMAPPGQRKQIERAWSEYNHHWAGFFVLSMGLLAALERLGVRLARHWPLVFFGLAAFLFVRNDPKAWPLGPAGFWETLTVPDVLQHRIFVLLVVLFGIFEWMVRTERVAASPWAYVFPALCAVGGGLLLTHSHGMFNLKQEFLTEVTHVPLGLFGAFCGYGRWLELRLPDSRRTSGWLSTACLTLVGVILLFYREG